MTSKILLPLAVVLVLSSCSTAYKAGQTPDDVYYSPVNTAKQQEREERQRQYEEYQVRQEDDQYLRMKVRNRNRWSNLDDYDYWNDSRYDFCYCNCNNNFGWNPYRFQNNFIGWNPYMGWGTWRNPIFVVAGYKNPKVYTGNTSMANINAFKNKTYNNVNTNVPFVKGQTSNTTFGRLLKQAFTNGNSSSSSSSESWGRPQRTYEPGTTTSSSAGGRSGGYSSSGSSSTAPRKSKN
jgi:hypothetical protein